MITSRSNWIDYKGILGRTYDGEAEITISCLRDKTKKTIVLKLCENGILIFDDKRNFIGFVNSTTKVKKSISIHVDFKLGLNTTGDYIVWVGCLDIYNNPCVYRFALEMV